MFEWCAFLYQEDFVMLLRIFSLAERKMFSVVRTALLLTAGLIMFAIAQDFFQSLRNGYAFYWTESLLFKVFWAFFVPVGYLAFLLVQRFYEVERNFEIGNDAAFGEKEAEANHYQWHNFLKVFFFVCFAIPIHAVLFSLTVYLCSAMFFDHTYSLIGNLTYTFSNDSILYVVVYSGAGFLAFRRFVNMPQPLLGAQQEYYSTGNNIGEKSIPTIPVLNHARQMFVGTTKHRVAVAFDDIICINSSSPYTAIQTKHKEYLHAETLKSLLFILPQEQFVRIHKSTIVNIHAVISYTSRLNGDYDILLSNRQEVRLSRNYARGFKERLEGANISR